MPSPTSPARSTQGSAAAVLVRTGKYRAGDETRFSPKPTATVADLSAATDWILARRAP